ncbi:hypothetical protein C8R46DRAFT_1246441 [Mycena filopes]|nr:hypothetical protein C8R46DRAFT_1246441 [Mycena filopes]
MDPVFQLGDLEWLPFSTRRMTLSAAQGNSRDVMKLHDLMEKLGAADDDSATWKVFVPVWYANLDAARIPNDDRLDLHSTFDEGAVVNANFAVRGLTALIMTYGGAPPPSAFPQLWTRLWPWIQFYDNYRDQFPGDDIAGSPFLIIAHAYVDEHKKLFYSTPGFYRVIGGGWLPLLECGNTLRVAYGINMLTDLLFTKMRPTTRAHVEELIEGAGGLDGLARCVVGYFDQIAADGDTPQLKRERRLLGGIFDFINDVDRLLSSKKPDGAFLAPFSAALVDSQAIRALTAMAGILGTSTTRRQEFEPILSRTLKFLHRIFTTAPNRYAILDAQDAGLIATIVYCGSYNSKFGDTLKALINDVLPSSLIHYEELFLIKKTIHDLKLGAALPSSFRSTAVYDSWSSFLTLLQERLKILDSVQSHAPRLKACDNAKCCKIADSALFHRCSNCLGFYYSSPECQQVDWKDGEHQKSCNSFHSLRLSERQPLPNRKRAFLRAVFKHDYTAAKLAEVYPQQILLASKHGKSQPLVTLFDYRAAGGRVRIEVQTPDALTLSSKDFDGWWNDVQRAARSGGRIHLHVIALPDGPGGLGRSRDTEYLLMPLRTETSQAQDVLDGFARRLPSGAEIQVVRDLVKRGKSALDGPGKETY